MRTLFSFDDGAASDMHLAELMDRYGFNNIIFYIPSRWEEHNRELGREPLTKAQVRELSDRFEVQSHTCTHPMLTRIPIEMAEAEIVDSKYELEDFLGKSVTKFCYPRGYANDEIRSIVRKHYVEARNTLVGSLWPSDDPIWQSTTVHAGGKRRKEYAGTTWLTEAQKWLREAARQDALGIDVDVKIWAHSWELTREDAWGEFELLLKQLVQVKEASYA